MTTEDCNPKFICQPERDWELILHELKGLLNKEKNGSQDYFDLWHERGIYHGSWTVFGLYTFGKKLAENCNRCPITTEIVEAIPGMTTAGFSAIAPKSRIFPHTGYTNKVLRCHLGLIIPKGATKTGKGDYHARKNNECVLKVEIIFTTGNLARHLFLMIPKFMKHGITVMKPGIFF